MRVGTMIDSLSELTGTEHPMGSGAEAQIVSPVVEVLGSVDWSQSAWITLIPRRRTTGTCACSHRKAVTRTCSRRLADYSLFCVSGEGFADLHRAPFRQSVSRSVGPR